MSPLLANRMDMILQIWRETYCICILRLTTNYLVIKAISPMIKRGLEGPYSRYSQNYSLNSTRL